MKMKATTLSIWCITTTIIISASSSSSSHAFVSTQHKNYYSPRVITSSLAQTQRDEEDASSLLQVGDVDNHRRTLLLISLLSCCCQPAPSYANNDISVLPSDILIQGIHDPQLQNYIHPLLPNWKGTALPGPLSLSEAYSQLILPSLLPQSGQDSTSENTALTATTTTFPMGKWPDPILRTPSSPIPQSTFQNKSQLQKLQSIAATLRNTARQEGAVGLAAQQCGIDVSLIYIDGVTVDDTALSSPLSSYRTVIDSNNNGISALGGVFGQSNWRNSKKQLTGEGVLIDDEYTNHRSSNTRLFPRMGKQPSSPPMKQEQGIFLVNPRIIHRSSESDMLVWTEECLVLPPEFRATLLRDAEVTIEYETLTTTTTNNSNNVEESSCGETKQITLRGELARCAQHEMDHDRGVLIVDHVGLEDLLSINGQTLMEDIENSDGRHANRMQRAYARDVSDSVLLPSVRTHRNVDLAFGSRNDFLAKKVNYGVESEMDGNDVRHPWFVPPANAVESVTNTKNYSASSSSSNAQNTRPGSFDNGTTTIPCDDSCLEDRKRRIQERRDMMQQSRSATNRGDVLELSRQRALMYGTSYKGLSPGACAQPGFCP